jgi:hypothetical protein
LSQIYKSSSTGPSPPTVATQFTADDSTVAIPSSNNLNVFSRDTTDNNVNGVQTTADPNNSENLYVEITNRFHASGSTVGATTDDLVTFALGGSARTFLFNFNVAGFESSTPASAGFNTYTTVRTDGATATIVDDTDAITHTDSALTSTKAEVIASGNNAILRVTGEAGLTVSWTTVGTYIRTT